MCNSFFCIQTVKFFIRKREKTVLNVAPFNILCASLAKQCRTTSMAYVRLISRHIQLTSSKISAVFWPTMYSNNADVNGDVRPTHDVLSTWWIGLCLLPDYLLCPCSISVWPVQTRETTVYWIKSGRVAWWRPVARPEASYLLTTSVGRRRSLRGRYYGHTVGVQQNARWGGYWDLCT